MNLNPNKRAWNLFLRIDSAHYLHYLNMKVRGKSKFFIFFTNIDVIEWFLSSVTQIIIEYTLQAKKY